MALQLAPETESRVREHAARNGVSVDELLRRAFADDLPASVALAPPPVAEETPEESHARVMALLAERQAKYGLPVPPGGFKPLGQLFAEWNEEDAKMTNEEIEEERRFWEDYERERPNRPLQI